MKLVYCTPKNNHFFSGYYDKSPLNSENKILLCLKTDFLDRLPGKNDKAELGFFNLDEPNQFISLSTISSFNWQQGNMLQWLGPDHKDKIIYNNFEKEKFISKIYDIYTHESFEINEPIYSLTTKGDLAFSIDFERHFWCRRGYAYSNIQCKSKDVKILEGDGINQINLRTGDSKKIVLVEELIERFFVSSMKKSTNWVEHIMPNPSGTRIAFLHRWRLDSGEIFAHLITSDTEGKDLKLLNHSGRFSHFCWKNDETIFGWGSYQSKVASIRKKLSFLTPLLPVAKRIYRLAIKSNPQDGLTQISSKLTGDSYMTIQDQDGETEKLINPEMNKDGHPSFSPSSPSIFITDTYPQNGKAQLICYDIDSNQIVHKGEFNSIEQLDETACRCDLHPKWSYDGKFVCIDTMDRGIRSIYILQV